MPLQVQQRTSKRLGRDRWRQHVFDPVRYNVGQQTAQQALLARPFIVRTREATQRAGYQAECVIEPETGRLLAIEATARIGLP